MQPRQKNALIGRSRAFRAMLREVDRVTRVEAPLLLSGETGTGKELVARGVHYGGKRGGGPFVPVNCAGIPDALLENELFGHAAGAYTGAVGRQRGLVQEAEGGTVFLDEVDSLPAASQSKILRFLQELEYRPLGSTRTARADVRIIAATNCDLAALCEQERFRADLYYRLHVFHIEIPPVRERAADAALLVDHFSSHYAATYSLCEPSWSESAMEKIRDYSWPGNVREIQAVVQRALLRADTVVRADDLDIPETEPNSLAEPMPLERFSEAKARVIAAFERDYLTRVLATCEGNVTQAAASAGKERRAFQRLIRKYAIDREQFAT